MTRPQPQGFDTRRVERLLEAAGGATRAGSRVDVISAKLIGKPYQSNPLIGSADTPEVFAVSTDRFDCVTYIETVFALARSRDAGRFVDVLRRIRYADGKVEWSFRNHYMTEWIRNNVRGGWIRRPPALPADIAKDRLLTVVPGLSPRRAKFHCIPKSALLRHSDKIETGDLIFFASTRTHLDVFHCGILIRNGDRVLLRHASRSKGGVVEQPLEEFLKQNRMAGAIVVRPTESN
jgi:cell wall-associated NlpC family hydrolase